MAGAAACAGVAGAGPAALVIRLGVLEVGVSCVAGAGREGAGAVADLDQVAELVAWLVGGGLMAVVASVGGDRAEAHSELPAARGGERPGAVAVRRARPSGRPRACLVCWGRAAARGERPGAVVAGAAGEAGQGGGRDGEVEAGGEPGGGGAGRGRTGLAGSSASGSGRAQPWPVA